MFTEIIKDKWENKNKNDKAAIELWNSKADYFGSYELENVQNERFIQIIKENNLINKDSFILDVGCGAGKYCAALADDCFKCIGTDLVMACMTPAISNYETFKKFMDCSKSAGIYCCGTRRTDSVSDEIDKLLGIKNKKSNSEDTVKYVFNILWENGYYPKIEYIEQSWDSEMSIEKSCEVYINRCKAKYDIDENQEQIIKKYIEEISINGLIYEKINTIKAVVYWKN